MLSKIDRAMVIGSVLTASIIAAAWALNYQISKGQEFDCPDTDLSSLNTEFIVRTPSASSFPLGYELRATTSHDETVNLFYSDRTICPFPKLFEGEVPAKTILVSVVHRTDIENGEQFIMEQLAIQKETISTAEYVDINGMPGYGWNSFISNVVSENSDVGAMRYPSQVAFYNAEDKTIYTVAAIEPLSRLIEVSNSIS